MLFYNTKKYWKIRDYAVKLRNDGLSYREIHEKTGLPKSTLSDWLHNISLTEEQMDRLKKLGGIGHFKASQAHIETRKRHTQEIFKEAQKDIKAISNRELLYMGTMLYWAEGEKQKEYNPSKRVVFSNSDPSMIKLYLKWLKECLKVHTEDVYFEIYIHETYRKTVEQLGTYWANVTGESITSFSRVYFKKNKVHTYRKNTGVNYHGVLRVMVHRSTDLNRKISGWIRSICEYTKCNYSFD